MMRGSTPSKFSANEFGEDEEDELESDEAYLLKIPDPDHLPSQTCLEEFARDDGKISRLFSDGRREVTFPNGVRREQWPDGYSLVLFTNGDIK